MAVATLCLSHYREHIQDVSTKGRDGQAVSGGLKLILIMKECSKARPFGITAISINSSTVSDQELKITP